MAIVSNVDNTTYEVYEFKNISFENEIQCIQFAQQNYTPINIHVNNFYKTEGVLYDFACVSNEEYKVLLDTSTEN